MRRITAAVLISVIFGIAFTFGLLEYDEHLKELKAEKELRDQEIREAVQEAIYFIFGTPVERIPIYNSRAIITYRKDPNDTVAMKWISVDTLRYRIDSIGRFIRWSLPIHTIMNDTLECDARNDPYKYPQEDPNE